jgi:hypothetical protein
MNKHKLLSVIRLLFAALGLAAVIVQLSNSISTGRSVSNFFSFFTIESNILAIVLFILLGVSGLFEKSPREYTFLRGGVTLFMTLTGIIYGTLLSGNEVALQTTIPWVNTVLHYVMPVVVLADWLINPPKQRILFKKAILWLIFPLAYLAYSIIRGNIVGWYPYPFINPILHSWTYVLTMSAIIAAVTIILAWVVCLTTVTSPTKKKVPTRA